MDIDVKSAVAVAGLLPKALEVAKKVWSNIDQQLDHSIRAAHLNYATNVISKHSYAKTFLIRSAPAYLYDFYVPASVDRRSNERVGQVDIVKLAAISKRLIITGSGGSGKTVLMRHLLLDALASAHKFPVLVELRNLNDNDDRTLDAEIKETLRNHGFDLDEDFIDKSFRDDVFVLLLDGFDEVQRSRRRGLEREIRKFANATDCQIVITSRSDESLQSWSQFTNVQISNLTLDEACDLVQKITFD